MKKLMFAAAVAALSTATMAADSIVSSSVVGYQNKALKADYAFNLTVDTFQTVGKEKSAMTLGDIKPNADWMGGSDEILILSNNGAVQSRYTYMNATDAANWGFTEGWYITDEYNDSDIDLTDLNKNSTVLPLGNGVVALVGLSTTTLTYAGQVLEDDQPITLKADYAFNITGNISPADITLGDIVPNNDWMGGSDELLVLANNGAVAARYTYMNETDAANWGFTPGWYITDEYNDSDLNLTGREKNSLPVKAGEAFVVFVGSSATTITIPSAL